MAPLSPLFLVSLIFISAISAQIHNPNATVLNHTRGSCGLNSVVTTSTTVLGESTIDDYQLNFVSGDNQIIYVRTFDGKLYRSGDEGFSWVEQTKNSILPGSENQTNPVQLLVYKESIDKIVTVYIISPKGDLWVSRDSGLTYELLTTLPYGTFALYINPADSHKVIARRWMQGPSPSGHELWRSDDAGRTWNLILQDVSPYGPVAWSVFLGAPLDRIFAQKLLAARSNPYQSQILWSDDSFASSYIVDLGDGMTSSSVLYWWHWAPNKMVVVTCIDLATCSQRELLLSEDQGLTFILSYFPRDKKDEVSATDFRVYETSETAVWIAIPGSQCTTGNYKCNDNVYHSNDYGDNFTLTLQRSVPWEFTKYAGSEGVYVANVFDNEIDYNKNTLISWNQGSKWKKLQAPIYDSKGVPTNCLIANGCSLHIHGYQSDVPFAWFYSTPNMPGIMIANGNLGTKLESAWTSDVYYSRNNGVNWTQVAKGPHVPEMGDHGAAIVLSALSLSPSVIYTVNDGASWDTCDFSPVPMFTRNIRVSGGWDSTRFLLYGRRNNSATGKEESVLVHLNFDDSFTLGACNVSRGDYENWSARTENGECVLGKQQIIQRRKQGRPCYYEEETVHYTTTQVCPCDEDDYECDHCFYRPTLQDVCTLDCSVEGLPEQTPEVCATKDYYEVDMGYRLGHGDACNPNLAGATKPKARVPCSFPLPDGILNAKSRRNQGFLIALYLTIAILAVLLVALLLWKYNDSFYRRIKHTFGVDNCLGRGDEYEDVALDEEDSDLEKDQGQVALEPAPEEASGSSEGAL